MKKILALLLALTMILAAGLEISGGTNGTVITLNMQVYVAGKDALLTVK